MSAENGLLLEVQGLRRRFGAVQALRGVDLSLPPGSIGLLGPNGAGKSTLIKILLGLLRPTAGRARVLGHDATARSLQLRARLGYMPEGESYVAGLDAVQLCSYAGQLCGLPADAAQQRAHAVLAFVGLEDKRYLQVQTYSTGQKQRVKLAQALVHDPELLLLDEPTNGLDPRGRDEMLRLIGELPRRRGCSVLLSSHLLPDVEAVCQSAILLESGQVRYSGPIAAMGDEDEELFEVQVKAGAEALAEELSRVGCRVERQGRALQVGLPAGEQPNLIFARALALELQVRHLAPARRSLEQAFLELLAGEEAPR